MTARRKALRSMLAAAVAAALPALGQPARRTARVGILASARPSDPGIAPLHAAFLAELRSRGWVEGQNLVIEGRYAEGRAERFPVLAAELVDAGVDVIVASGSQATAAARDKTRSIPIVMVALSDPVEAGYVASLARPGGNVTGVTNLTGVIAVKNLELLHEVKPDAKRIGILWSPKDAGSALAFRREQVAGQKLGLQVVSLPVVFPAEIDHALEIAQRERLQGLRVHPTPAVFQMAGKVAAWAVEQRVPTVSGPRSLVQVGLLAAYGPNYLDISRIAATYVDRILRGANPAEMPVEQPTKFLLVVNLKTAKAIGITIPRSVLLRADEVIE